MAYAGHALALRLCLERTIVPRRDRPEPFRLPPVESAADLAPAMDSVLAAVSRGEITTSQAVELSMVVATRLRAVEVDEFNRRLSAIEHGDTRH
jgi:translation elongation factor EF-Tu-like GTPase